jgi:hypothetical protein
MVPAALRGVDLQQPPSKKGTKMGMKKPPAGGLGCQLSWVQG